MNTFFERIVNKVQQTSEQIHDLFQQYVHGEKVTVNDVMTFIKNHPDSHKTKQLLLGQYYNQYTLEKQGFQFVLETKEALNGSEKAIALTTTHDGKSIVKYRSYQNKSALHDYLHIPKEAMH